MPFLKLVWAVALIFICAGAPNAIAEQKAEEYKKPLAEIPFLPKNEFEKKTEKINDSTLGDTALHFEFRLPLGWKKPAEFGMGRDAINSKILMETARYYGPPTGDLRSYITVQAARLEHKDSADFWLTQFLLSNAYRLYGYKEHSPSRAEVLYSYIDSADSYVVRAVVVINGDYALLFSYYLPESAWEEEKSLQAQVIDSVRPQQALDSPVEKMETYHFLDLAAFDYPKSWQIRAQPIRSIDDVRVDLFNVASKENRYQEKLLNLNGKITVVIRSANAVESVEGEIRKFKSNLQRTGLVLDKPLDVTDDFKTNPNVEAQPVEVFSTYERESRIINYQLWIKGLRSGGFYYFMALLTPSKEDNYLAWSQNMNAYRSIMESLKPTKDSILNEQ